LGATRTPAGSLHASDGWNRIQRVLAGTALRGAHPLARAFGDDFALALPGVKLARIALPAVDAAA
jgi:hypothetical protein